MVAPLVILGAIIVGLVALALLLYYASYLDNAAAQCLNNVNAIISQINNIQDNPASANVWCEAAKKSMDTFNKACPGYSIPTYEHISPPCP